MKIISESQDYYDQAGPGNLQSPVYTRKNLPLPEDLEIRSGNIIEPDWEHDNYISNYFPEMSVIIGDSFEDHFHEEMADFFLVICGKCYPLIQENRLANKIAYDRCSGKRKKITYREPFVVFNKERHIGLLIEGKKPTDSIPYLDKNIAKEKPFLVELSKRIGLPVFICQTSANNRELCFKGLDAVVWQEPPLLSSLHLKEIYPAEQLHSDIAAFIKKYLTD